MLLRHIAVATAEVGFFPLTSDSQMESMWSSIKNWKQMKNRALKDRELKANTEDKLSVEEKILRSVRAQEY